MKMVIRADDIGYTKVCNIGAFEAMEQGVVTAADVMLDTPGTEDALERLRALPWISIGWHTHFWGAPVLPPEQVPTLYDKARGHFRTDLESAADVSVEECRMEMRAQLDRCIRILGRAPDTCFLFQIDTPFREAIRRTTEEYGMVTDFSFNKPMRGNQDVGTKREFMPPQDARWTDRKIYMVSVPGPGSNVFDCLQTDSLAKQREYDPIRFWTANESHFEEIPEDGVAVVILHPGYIDYYVCREGDQTPFGQRFLSIRAADVHALCDPALHRWLVDNRVELVNFRDALYGTQEYQNHLRAIGSDLFMKK